MLFNLDSILFHMLNLSERLRDKYTRAQPNILRHCKVCNLEKRQSAFLIYSLTNIVDISWEWFLYNIILIYHGRTEGLRDDLSPPDS